MSTGWGKAPLRIFLQMVERLRMPVRRSTSWQVINSVFDMTDSSSFKGSVTGAVLPSGVAG
jgi:hypothetical protein